MKSSFCRLIVKIQEIKEREDTKILDSKKTQNFIFKEMTIWLTADLSTAMEARRHQNVYSKCYEEIDINSKFYIQQNYFLRMRTK